MIDVIKRFLNRTKTKLTRGYDKNIDMKKLEELKRYNAIIIDVRSPQEYREGHIENSLSIPEYELKKRAETELANKEQTIILYCSTGNRSRRAKKTLEKLGYTQVYNLANGCRAIS